MSTQTGTHNPTTITAEPGAPFVEIAREFEAPVAAVFRAHTDRDLYERWLGPRETALEVTALDPTVGGAWSYLMRGEDGATYGFRGVFHSVDADAFLVQTFEFDGYPGQVGLSATTFEPLGDRCRIVVREVYPSVEARDGMLASGMEQGVVEGYERLDEILAG
jgi:uncharacterized protein YndB with AHSA1/START domain